ncbi:hypothetical protein ACFLSY_08465 [Bacteroidota bacterium]
MIKRKYLYLLIMCSLLISCETEIDISYEEEVLPVVYGLIERDIKPYRRGVYEYPSVYTNYIKIGKSFYATYRPDLTAKITDSLYFNEAKVKLQYCFMGEVISETILEKTTGIIKDNGFFSDDKNILYKTVPHNFPARMDTVRLVIELPGLEKIITSSTPKRAAPQLFSPRWIFEEGREITFYYNNRGNYFEVLWYDWGGYYELFMKVNYTNYYYSGLQEQKAVSYQRSYLSNRKPEWDYMNWYETWDEGRWYIYSNGSVISKIFFYADEFYRFINMSIKEDPDIEYRRFNNIEFSINNADKEYFEYINFGTTMVDQGRKFTNINNGLGIFSCISKTVKSNVLLKQQSLDSLAQGKFTKHLKFRNY